MQIARATKWWCLFAKCRDNKIKRKKELSHWRCSVSYKIRTPLCIEQMEQNLTLLRISSSLLEERTIKINVTAAKRVGKKDIKIWITSKLLTGACPSNNHPFLVTIQRDGLSTQSNNGSILAQLHWHQGWQQRIMKCNKEELLQQELIWRRRQSLSSQSVQIEETTNQRSSKPAIVK